jgi:Dynein associated protein/CAP-Gly domain
MWVGQASEKDERIFLGVELDKPRSSGHNGTVKGRVLFKCREKCGLVLAPSRFVKLQVDEEEKNVAEKKVEVAKAAKVEEKKQAIVEAKSVSKEDIDCLVDERVKKRIDALESRYRDEIGELERYKSASEVEKRELQEFAANCEKQCVELRDQVARARKAQLDSERSASESNAQAGAELKERFERERAQWLKDKAALEEHVEELSDTAEMLTLDKELVDEQCDELRQALRDQEAELKRVVEQSQADVNDDDGDGDEATTPTSGDESYEQVVARAARLESALRKLHELSASVKAKAEEDAAALEAENERLGDVEERLITVEAELLNATEEIDELKESLDLASEAESMVQTLSTKSMALQDRVAELEAAAAELEELRELSEELEESQQQAAKDLRAELYAKEVEALELADRAASLQRQLDEALATNALYRTRTAALQERIAALDSSRHLVAAEAGEASDKRRSLLDENIRLRDQLRAYTEMRVRASLSRFQASMSARHLAYLRSFLPARVFDGDNGAVQALLTLHLAAHKARLVAEHVDEAQPNLASLSARVPAYELDARLFALHLRRHATAIERAANARRHQLLAADSLDEYSALAKLQLDTSFVHAELDRLVSLIAQQELNETYALHLPELAAAADRFASVLGIDACRYSPSLLLADLINALLSLRFAKQRLLVNEEEEEEEKEEEEKEENEKEEEERVLSVVERMIKTANKMRRVLDNGVGQGSVDAQLLLSSKRLALQRAAKLDDAWAALSSNTAVQDARVDDAQLVFDALAKQIGEGSDDAATLDQLLARLDEPLGDACDQLVAMLSALESGSLDGGAAAAQSSESESESTTTTLTLAADAASFVASSVWLTRPEVVKREIDEAVGLKKRFVELQDVSSSQQRRLATVSDELATLEKRERMLNEQCEHAQRVAREKSDELKSNSADWSDERRLFESSIERLQSQIDTLQESLSSARPAMASSASAPAQPRQQQVEAAPSAAASVATIAAPSHAPLAASADIAALQSLVSTLHRRSLAARAKLDFAVTERSSSVDKQLFESALSSASTIRQRLGALASASVVRL